MDMETTVARRGVNEKDVWTAADALLLEGRRPTIESVRVKIGRGSPNTITPYLDTWFKGLGRRLQDPGAYARAPAVPEPMAAAALHFWEAALALARRQAEDGMASEREALVAARAEVAASLARLAEEAMTFNARREAIEETLALAKSQLTEATRNARTSDDRCQLLERRCAELEEELRSGTATWEAERKSAAAEARRVAQERSEDRSRHEAAERRWLAEVDRARGETTKLAKQLADHETRRRAAEAAAHKRIEALQDDLTATRRELLARTTSTAPGRATKPGRSRTRVASRANKQTNPRGTRKRLIG